MEELLSKYSLNTVFHMIRNHQYEIPIPKEATITHQVVLYAGFDLGFLQYVLVKRLKYRLIKD